MDKQRDEVQWREERLLLVNGLIYLNATVNMHPVRGILDTGARSNIMSRHVFKKLGLVAENDRPQVILKTASSEELTPSFSTKCLVQFGSNNPVETSFLVLEQFEYGVLFGTRLLDRLRAEISFVERQIKIGNYIADMDTGERKTTKGPLFTIIEDVAQEEEGNESKEQQRDERSRETTPKTFEKSSFQNKDEETNSFVEAIERSRSTLSFSPDCTIPYLVKETVSEYVPVSVISQSETVVPNPENNSVSQSVSAEGRPHSSVALNTVFDQVSVHKDSVNDLVIVPAPDQVVHDRDNVSESIPVQENQVRDLVPFVSVSVHGDCGINVSGRGAFVRDIVPVSIPVHVNHGRDLVVIVPVKNDADERHYTQKELEISRSNDEDFEPFAERENIRNTLQRIEHSAVNDVPAELGNFFTIDHREEDDEPSHKRYQIMLVRSEMPPVERNGVDTDTDHVCGNAVRFLDEYEKEQQEQGIEAAGEYEAIIIIDEDMADVLEQEWDQETECAHCFHGNDTPVSMTEIPLAPSDENTVVTDTADNGNDEEKQRNAETEKFLADVRKNMGKQLTDEQKKTYEELLLKYRDIFAKDSFDVGIVSGIEHHIDTGNHEPISEGLRRKNPIQTEELRRQVTILMKMGFIRESIGNPWAAPAVLVKKRDGSFRFCIDHRRLNAITKKDKTPLPRIDDIHDHLAHAKFHTSIDIVQGYYHVPLEASSCEKTGFLTPFGQFEWTRMTMGLCNAPATFQRLMNRVLGENMYKFCLAYLDDIIGYSTTFEEHMAHVTYLFDRIRAAGLHAKLPKCRFGDDKTLFLGSVVSASGVTVDESKIESVKKFPIPKNQLMVRAFLGLTGYYRRFVLNYANEARPLINLTKNVKFEWGPEQQASFETLKLKVVEAPILVHPDFKRDFYIHCDASNYGVGAILKQKDDEGRERVIAYTSRILQPH